MLSKSKKSKSTRRSKSTKPRTHRSKSAKRSPKKSRSKSKAKRSRTAGSRRRSKSGSRKRNNPYLIFVKKHYNHASKYLEKTKEKVNGKSSIKDGKVRSTAVISILAKAWRDDKYRKKIGC